VVEPEVAAFKTKSRPECWDGIRVLNAAGRGWSEMSIS
jgi:hypothetical protein